MVDPATLFGSYRPSQTSHRGLSPARVATSVLGRPEERRVVAWPPGYSGGRETATDVPAHRVSERATASMVFHDRPTPRETPTSHLLLRARYPPAGDR